MGWITSFFGLDGSMHQVTRTGDVITDLSTGRTGFVVSDNGDMSMVTDQCGHLHRLMKNSSMTTDLSTGRTYFEI